MVQEAMGFQEPRGWPRSYEVRGPSIGGSGGHRDFRSLRGGQEAMGSRDLVQEFREVIRISGAQGGGQEAMGSGDLVQEVQGGIGIPGAQGLARRLWGLET